MNHKTPSGSTVSHSGTRLLIMLAAALITLPGALLWSGCGTFQRTAGQADAFRTEQRGYRLTAEELAAIPVLVDERTVEHLDAEGRVTKREITSIQRGYPSAIRDTTTATSAAFTDSALNLEQDANPAGSRVRLDRSTQGNADTLGLTTAAQVQRAEIESQMAGAIVAGAVKAAVEAVVPIQIARQEQHTARTSIRADRDVRLAELAPAEEEHAPEGEANSAGQQPAGSEVAQ